MPLASSALVLFSGGQDSTVCLAWALSRFARVETVGFDYGQRHASELAARPRILDKLREDFPDWSERLGEDHLLPLDVLKVIGGSALTDAMKIEMGENGSAHQFRARPQCDVPDRRRGAGLSPRHLRSGGRHVRDGFSGYPDCRDETVQATARALSLGVARDVRVHTPLMWIDKAATWALARNLAARRWYS